MPDEAFQTARFEVHNPSRHKQTMLLAALREYHRIAKQVLERSTADPDLMQKCLGPTNARGVATPNRFVTAKFVRGLAPLRWNMAPLRDYLIGDITAALMSYLEKSHKGKTEPIHRQLHSTTTNRKILFRYREELAWHCQFRFQFASNLPGFLRSRAYYPG